MRKMIIGFFLLAITGLHAQDVDYKKGVITVDGKEYAKLEVKKQNFGLTKSFEVFSMTGTKLIIAVVATEFEQDKSDNSYLFYRLTFLTSNQVGIFKIQSLSQEKSFAKLIGGSGIVIDNKTDDNKVKEFIAYKGASPRIATDYTCVPRDRSWPIEIKDDKTIVQESKLIGSFKPTGSIDGQDYYEVLLPSTVVIARLSFTGGNNAENFELFTVKDSQKRIVAIPTDKKIIAASVGVDKNYFTMKRIIKWLVENKYL